MASLTSRSGTCLPPKGWICTVGAYCEHCGVCDDVTDLDGIAYRCQPGVTSPIAAEGSPHPASPPRLYTATRRVARALSPTFALDLSLSVRFSLCHAAPTPRRRGARQGPGRSSRRLATVVPTSLRRGAPKAPSRLGRWAVRRFVCGRATRIASLASRSGTCVPPEEWICTVGAYCDHCELCGDVTASMALPISNFFYIILCFFTLCL